MLKPNTIDDPFNPATQREEEEQAKVGVMAAVDLSKLVKEKRFWVASFLVAWAAALQGHMMWVQRQDAFKDKFGDPEAPNKVTEGEQQQPANSFSGEQEQGRVTADAELR